MKDNWKNPDNCHHKTVSSRNGEKMGKVEICNTWKANDEEKYKNVEKQRRENMAH